MGIIINKFNVILTFLGGKHQTCLCLNNLFIEQKKKTEKNMKNICNRYN